MAEPELLAPRAIRLDEEAADRDGAIRRCGAVLVELGAVGPDYPAAMLERERMASTYVGEGIAVPHGTAAAAANGVRRDALAVLRFPAGVQWDGHRVVVCVAIAATADRHLTVLATLSDVLLDPARAGALRAATLPATVLDLLRPSPVPAA